MRVVPAAGPDPEAGRPVRAARQAVAAQAAPVGQQAEVAQVADSQRFRVDPVVHFPAAAFRSQRCPVSRELIAGTA